MSQVVELFTDGACKGNPGVGGWGVLLRYGTTERELYGYQADTTNNQMELMAAIRGLEALTRPCHVKLTTDSKYVLQGMTEWIAAWKKKGWKSANGQAVKNQELWQRLDQAARPHQIEWQWVRGHTGHAENERVDALANRAIEEKFIG
ncbi:ribonuclease HI [Thiolinea disciformis]|uniref:ribonuclease HI n=1 Tax=Thiolinea disciformis TaxID=125614 RepID=UPI00036D4BCF|nr:ribonuclease HI [Thiolinea disciformis]